MNRVKIRKSRFQDQVFLIWRSGFTIENQGDQDQVEIRKSNLPNYFHNFFSVWAVEKDNKLLIGPELIFFSHLWTIEIFVFFFNCSTEKILWKKLGETRFVVWCVDVTNWLKVMKKYWIPNRSFFKIGCVLGLKSSKNLEIWMKLRIFLIKSWIYLCPNISKWWFFDH